MRELYCPRYFSQIVPIMMFVRYVGGDECWHRDTDYANLTIDDPSLTEPYGNLNFKKLLTEMEKYNFHTTIAFIPWNYDRSQPDVGKLFLDNPDRYSLIVHGNNHDHYEFNETVPLDEQEKDIIEALNRMEKHKELTSIPYGKVMIFPHGIPPVKTLEFLKKYNFNITVNAQDVPLGATRPENYDYEMEPANMDYANFASVKRHSCRYQEYVFDLFLDKPALFYNHHNFFAEGIDAFNSIAKDVNDLAGEVEWKSLGEIAKHLYLKKTNDNGAIDVKMYGNNLILSNDSEISNVYHIHKEENLNVPIAKLTIDDMETNYVVEEGVLKIGRVISANDSIKIKIIYTEKIPQIAKFPTGPFRNWRKAGVRICYLRMASNFRDMFVSRTKVGRGFISLYYTYRPFALGIRYFALGIAVLCMIVPISLFIVVIKLRPRKRKA